MDSPHPVRVVWGYRWWLLLLAVAATAGGYFYSSSRTSIYEADALVQVVSGRQSSGEFVGPEELLRLTNLYAKLARTRPVAESAAKEGVAELSELERMVEVATEPQLEVVRFTARSPNAALAVNSANAYARAFANHVKELQAAQRQEALSRVQSRVREIETDLVQRPPSDPTRVAASAELEALQAEAAEARVQAGDSGRIIEPAEVPQAPVSPKPSRDAALSFLGALLGGSALTYLRFSLSDRYGSAEEAAADLGLSRLGELPRSPGEDELALEAFRALRTSIVFATRDRESPILLVTSPEAGAGKSYVVTNLAQAFAADGRRVVAVDADLRRPVLHERLGVPLEPGLGDLLANEPSGTTDLLINDVRLSRVVQRRGGDLDAVAAGHHVADSAEMLSSPRMGEALQALRESYDVVILDSPPAVAVVDAVVLARYCHGVIFLVDARRGRRREARRALHTLRAVEAPVLGLVFNRSSTAERRYGYSNYAPRESSVRVGASP